MERIISHRLLTISHGDEISSGFSRFPGRKSRSGESSKKARLNKAFHLCISIMERKAENALYIFGHTLSFTLMRQIKYNNKTNKKKTVTIRRK